VAGELSHTGFMKAYNDHLQALSSIDFEQVRRITERIRTCKGIVYWMGNGGSTADSQHMAGELMGVGIKSIALTDSSVLTATANDICYEDVFAAQIATLCTENDILIGLTTSGKSRNIIDGFLVADALDVYTIAFTGRQPLYVDECVNIDSDSTPRIQEAHEFIGHLIYEEIKAEKDS